MHEQSFSKEKLARTEDSRHLFIVVFCRFWIVEIELVLICSPSANFVDVNRNQLVVKITKQVALYATSRK